MSEITENRAGRDAASLDDVAATPGEADGAAASSATASNAAASRPVRSWVISLIGYSLSCGRRRIPRSRSRP